MSTVFDTNILIDYLDGFADAAAELNRASDRAISRITWIEVLVGAEHPEHEAWIRQTLRRIPVIEVTPAIAGRAVTIRRERRLKLPDALIYATVLDRGGRLVTRNTKDFSEDDPLVRVPYRR